MEIENYIHWVTSGLKQTVLFFLARIGLTSSRFDLEAYCQDNISINLGDCTLIHIYSSNNIIYINSPKIEGYFRECRRHNRFKSYLEDSLQKFFVFCPLDNKDSFIKEVSEAFEIKHNKKRFLNMGSMFVDYSPINRFVVSKDKRLIGLDSCNEIYDKNIYSLAHYFWSELYSYHLNKRLFHTNKYQTYNASRMLAQEEIANMLGIGYLLSKTSIVKIDFEGKWSCYGLLSSKVDGYNPTGKIKTSQLSPLIQRDLTSLNVLDVICYELDHKPDNYKLIKDSNGFYNSICSFDNDSPKSLFPSFSASTSSYFGSSPIIDINGRFNRPYLDYNLSQKIIDIKFDEVKKRLSPYLNSIQVMAVWKRMSKVRNAIIRLSNDSNKAFIKKEWNPIMMQEELSGNYGETYLSILFRQLNNNIEAK